MRLRAKHLFMVGLLSISVTGAGGVTPPHDPILIGPHDETTVHGINVSPTFKWQPVKDATSYRLCLSEPGPEPSKAQPECGGPGTHVYAEITSTSFAPPGGLPERFQGRTFGWQVAACNNLGCTYSPAPRRLTWSAIPQAPILDLPENRAKLYAFPRLVVVKPGAGATFYTLCFARQGVACGAEGSVVIEHLESESPSGNLFYNLTVDQVRAFAGQTVNWTAAACNAFGCTWQPATRPITIAGPPAAPALLKPEDSSTASSLSEGFEWSRVPWTTHYALCVSRPGVACGTEDSVIIGNIKENRSGTVSHTLDLSRVNVFAGQTVNWTAAACNAFGCTWQPVTRRITIPSAP